MGRRLGRRATRPTGRDARSDRATSRVGPGRRPGQGAARSATLVRCDQRCRNPDGGGVRALRARGAGDGRRGRRAGLTWAAAVDAFVVTNVAIGLSCAVAGLLVAWQRPRYPLGWLLLAAGVFQTASAAAASLDVLGVRRGWSPSALRVLETVFAYAWPWSIALSLPLALL